MKKLLQLLNEYKKGESFEFITYDEESKIFRIIPGICHKELTEETIISKKFGFIQRLIDNDKIILPKDIIRRVEYSNYGVLEDIHYYSAHKSILMYLAIQDDPIEFLVSVLR